MGVNMNINEDIKLRLLEDRESDYKNLEKWYKDRDVYLSFEQRILTYDEIQNKYKSRTKEDSDIKVYIINYKDKDIGIVQYKKVIIDKELYKINYDRAYEIDIFIGDNNYRNSGIGTIVINYISDYLLEDKDINIVIMSPLSNNKKAIRCYEKAGFKYINSYYDKDTIGNIQEYYLMIKR